MRTMARNMLIFRISKNTFKTININNKERKQQIKTTKNTIKEKTKVHILLYKF